MLPSAVKITGSTAKNVEIQCVVMAFMTFG